MPIKCCKVMLKTSHNRRGGFLYHPLSEWVLAGSSDERFGKAMRNLSSISARSLVRQLFGCICTTLTEESRTGGGGAEDSIPEDE